MICKFIIKMFFVIRLQKAPMIDWFRGSVPFLHQPLPVGSVLSIDVDGVIEWEAVKRLSVRGSYESSIRIRSSGGDGQGRSTHLDLDGNLTKFLQGHNLFGPNDLTPLVLATFRRILSSHPGLARDSSPEIAEQHIKRGDYLLNGIDLTEMYDVGNDPSVEAWLHACEMRAVKRGGRSTRDHGTVYLGKHSRRWAIKFYNKFRELLKHSLPDELNNSGLHQWAIGKVRAELRLHSLELKDRDITHGKHMTEQRVTALFNDYIGRVDMSAQTTLIDQELFDLPRSVQATYQLWRQGACLRSILPKNTFYRHRNVLKQHGIDIHLPPTDPDRSNVVPLLRLIEATPATIPDWAYEQNLVHLS